VRVTYAAETGITDVSRVEPVLPTQEKTDQGETPPAETRRGDPEGALAATEVKVDHTYVIPRENHNPIEMHATIAAWDGDRLSLWDKTQWVHNVADEIAAVFGIPAENIRVVSPFVGGAFGSGLRTWPHVTLAALGARVTGRPVKLMLSRREMYYGVGYRPHTVQRVALGASRDGRLAASSAPWTSSRWRWASIPSSCACATSRSRTSSRSCRSRAARQRHATGPPPSALAGAGATPSRARCATAAG
jgi:xanthine dehydrogenase YagR molybdenum-binding subunit